MEIKNLKVTGTLVTDNNEEHEITLLQSIAPIWYSCDGALTNISIDIESDNGSAFTIKGNVLDGCIFRQYRNPNYGCAWYFDESKIKEEPKKLRGQTKDLIIADYPLGDK